jgi:hypothetical protein
MKPLESPAVAEDKQRRKALYLPAVWPLVLALAIVIGIAIWTHQ